MPQLYKMDHPPEVAKVLEAMQSRLAQVCDVTVTGNRCTVRWYEDGELVDVHMIIESVLTPEEAQYRRTMTVDTPPDLELCMQVAKDIKKEFQYDKVTGKWAWYDRDERHNPMAYHAGFNTFRDALLDAVEPYLPPYVGD